MNLWADFEDKQGDHAGRLSHIPAVRSRRSTEQVVLSLLREWLLHDYAATYCRSLAASRIFRRCYWVDALGVPAKTDILQAIVPLSTLLTQESKPILLRGLVLEAGSSKRKEGRTSQNGSIHTKTIALPKESGLVRASWLEAASTLLTEIGSSPGIFLLNPFGQTLFTYDDLLPLYQRTVPTELLFLIPHRQLETLLANAQRTPAQASALTALLRTDRWKTLPIAEEERAQAVTSGIEMFIAAMQRHFSFPVQCINVPIQVRPAVVELVPYTLLFATRRQDSLVSMNNALCLYRRRVYEQSHRGVLAEEWFMQQHQERFEQESLRVTERIVLLGRAQRIRHWPELRQQVLLANFGQFTTHDYDTMLQELLRKGEVRCEWKKKEHEEAQVPGNEDTLLWQ